MPTREHETPLTLVNREPKILTWLLEHVGNLTLPKQSTLGDYPTETRTHLLPVHNADAVYSLQDRSGKPLMVIIFEVQRRFLRKKLCAWRAYLAHAELKLNVPGVLLVYTPRARVAERYRREATETGISLLVRPIIFSADDIPPITDPKSAEASPGLTVLSALAHGHEPTIDKAFPALLAALRRLDAADLNQYYDLVLAGLPATARTRWRDFMTTTIYRSTGTPYLSEEFNAAYKKGIADGEAKGEARGEARGEAKGEAKGLADSLVTVLRARELKLTKAAQRRIERTLDTAVLQTWLTRAVTATSVKDVLDG